MKENASFKEGRENEIPRHDSDPPGFASGEELAIDPAGGDEIDPIRKWWDEAETSSREKARNRRLRDPREGAEATCDGGSKVLDQEGDPPVSGEALEAGMAEDVGDSIPVNTGEKPRGKGGCQAVFVTLFVFAAFILLTGLIAGGWVAWSRLGDYESELVGSVRGKLEEKGIYLDLGKAGYQFSRGLVFDEVTIFDDATRRRPVLKASGIRYDIDWPGLLKSSGEIGAGEFHLYDASIALFETGHLITTIDRVNGTISTSQEHIRVEHLSAFLGSWQITLRGLVHLPSVSIAPGESPLPVAAPLMFDFSAFKALEFFPVSASDGAKAPTLDLTFAMDVGRPDLATIEGAVHGRDLIWQGVEITSVSAAFNRVNDTGLLSVPAFQIGCGRGFLGGRLAIDTVAESLRIEQLHSTVDVLALLGQYKPEWAARWKSVRFLDAPFLRISGEVPFKNPSAADLKIRYDQPQGIVLSLENGDLPLRGLRGNLELRGQSIETDDAGFELFGGTVKLNGATRLTGEAGLFNGLIELSDLSLGKARGVFDRREGGMSGNLSLVFRGVLHRDREKIRGGGTLRVEEAAAAHFPVFGPVEDHVGGAVPVFAVTNEGTINGAYLIESGVLIASDLIAANAAARLVANGTVNIISSDTDFNVRAELVPSLAVATGLTEKAITLRVKGPLGDPAVTLKTFPIEFASVSLGGILGTSPRSLETLGAVPGVEEAVGAFADQLGAPGITIHPEVSILFRSILSQGSSATGAVSPLRREQE